MQLREMVSESIPTPRFGGQGKRETARVLSLIFRGRNSVSEPVSNHLNRRYGINTDPRIPIPDPDCGLLNQKSGHFRPKYDDFLYSKLHLPPFAYRLTLFVNPFDTLNHEVIHFNEGIGFCLNINWGRGGI